MRNLQELFALLESEKERQIFVIGGAEVYAQLLPYCRNAYVTIVYRDFDGEKFFPKLDEMPDWEPEEKSDLEDYEGLKYCFVKYVNKSVKNFNK